jgi:FkbM family methyltransferase
MTNRIFPAKYIFLKNRRFDLIFKYIYIKNYKKNSTHIKFFEDLYCAHISAFNDFHEEWPTDLIPKESKEDFLSAFHKLYEDICANGFDCKKSRIPIDKHFEIGDGSHRLAIATSLNLDVMTTNCTISEYYNFNFFLKNGLNPLYADYAALEYVKFNKNSYIVLLHSVTNADEDHIIEDILKKFGFIFYKKKISLTFNGYVNLKKINYFDECNQVAWIGNLQNSYAGLQEHAHRSSGNSPLRVYIFVCDNIDKVLTAKKEIRSFYDIGNHSIHINDNHKEAATLAETLFNENSLLLLNSRPFDYENPKFEALLEEMKLEAHYAKVDIEDICIVGSSPLSAFGIRHGRDIDFLYCGDCEFTPINHNISSHKSQIDYYPYNEFEIIKNPLNYFYYKNIKLITLDVLYHMKQKRKELPKDIRDCHFIDEFRKNNIVCNKKRPFIFFRKDKFGNKRILTIFGIKITYTKNDKIFPKILYSKAVKLLKNNYYNNNHTNPFCGDENNSDKYYKNFFPVFQKIQVKYFINKMFNIHKLIRTYNSLSDIQSKKLFNSVILYRALGANKIKLPLADTARWGNVVQFEKNAKRHQFSNTNLYKYALDDFGYKVMCITARQRIYENIFLKKYMYKNHYICISPHISDIVIDAGASYGDNTLCFADMVGENGHVYAFEFMPDKLKIFHRNMLLNPQFSKRITLIEKAISDKNTKIFYYISNNKVIHHADRCGNINSMRGGECVKLSEIATCSVDKFSNDANVNHIDYIKLDIAGLEMQALRGMESVIRKHKPKLAISIHHKNSDYYEVYEYIKNLVPLYRFYFGHYTASTRGSILYAII